MENEVLTKAEIAKRYRVTVKSIDNWMVAGMPFLKGARSVRFVWSEVQQWMTENAKQQVESR